MMPFLQTYIDNLLSDWKLEVAAIKGASANGFTLQQQTANAKQEQIINSIKTLYDAALHQIRSEHNEHCSSLCAYIHNAMLPLLPMLAKTQFSQHLQKPLLLKTNLHQLHDC